VRQTRGPGDQGRDIIAYESAVEEDPWDLYQCKRYEAPLMPGDIWLELGKVAYHARRGDYSLPAHHIFVSPRGEGPMLAALLAQPERLRAGLIDNWVGKCRSSIAAEPVELTPDLRTYIAGIDFSRVSVASPLQLIEEHRRTPWYVARFGGGLPARPAPGVPPAAPAPAESVYVRALLDAYEEHLATSLSEAAALTDPPSIEHLELSRREFYSAESLREFSRDNVPPGTYEALLEEVYTGVMPVVAMEHADGLERVLKVVAQAMLLGLTSNALIVVTSTADRGGMCHQLANGERLRWRL